jgi:hypothetical protein
VKALIAALSRHGFNKRIPAGCLRAESAERLLAPYSDRIVSMRRSVGVGESHWAKLYQPLLDRFAALVQQFPPPRPTTTGEQAVSFATASGSRRRHCVCAGRDSCRRPRLNREDLPVNPKSRILLVERFPTGILESPRSLTNESNLAVDIR